MLSFEDNPNAFCEVAKCQRNTRDALAIFGTPVEDGSWTAAPEIYARHLAWPKFWGSETRDAACELRRRLVAAILAGPLNDAAHAALPEIFRTACLAPLENATDIVQWLIENAGPNDATMVAEALHNLLLSPDETQPRDCFPLVEWLLIKGSSEMRSGRRSRMVAKLLPLVVRFGRDELLAPAIRYVLYNEHPIGSDGRGQQTFEKLLPAIERLLEQSPNDGIIGDLFAGLEPTKFASYLEQVLRGWRRFPKGRAATVRRLARGEMTSETQRPPLETWISIVEGPVVEVEIDGLEVAQAAIAGLTRCGQERAAVGVELDSTGDWGFVLTREFLRVSGLLSTRSPGDVDRLRQCAGFHMAITRGVHRALLEAVEQAADPALDSVRELLASAGASQTIVLPALELLKGVTSSPSVMTKSASLETVIGAIEHALRVDSFSVCGFNFRQAINGATRVEVADFADERAFRIDDKVLSISRRDLEGLAALSNDLEVQRALGVLYVVHEVVHAFQGIAGRGRVSNVRFAGAESALMHVDLGADHIAAVIASSMFPAWDLLWLKDWQGKSIQGFPAGPRNPPYSRIRKTLRLVGLRVDHALRKLGIGIERMTPESYGFADFSPSGGAFIAMINRPPFVVVKTSSIDAADVNVLFEAIEGREGAIERTDDVIERALATSS